VALLPTIANRALVLAGHAPIAPAERLIAADLLRAEDGEDVRATAVALVAGTLDRSPADRDAHEALALALGPGPEGDAALRRALLLSPWAPEIRDQLALRLWDRGLHGEAARELEESTFRFPRLAGHAYLSPASDSVPSDAAELLRALAEGDTLIGRLRGLDDGKAAAVERGLERALATGIAGDARHAVVEDLATLREARGRPAEAADLLRAEAESGTEGTYLARAARDYVEAARSEAAEDTLLAALMHAPERGDLYKRLAVDVYARRGEFDTAATVLRAGERNAADVLPVYRGTAELLARREAARTEELAAAALTGAALERSGPASEVAGAPLLVPSAAEEALARPD
jgi:hypothetical protein